MNVCLAWVDNQKSQKTDGKVTCSFFLNGFFISGYSFKEESSFSCSLSQINVYFKADTHIIIADVITLTPMRGWNKQKVMNTLF